MKVLFWIAVGWLTYVYVGYPLAVWLLGLVRGIHPMIRKDEDELPFVSVLISARNEERDIGWKVQQTLAWDYPPEKLQVLVASDASEDCTDEILQSMRDPRLTFVRMPKRAGKNAALNRLARLAEGDILFFTDANSNIHANCLCRMVRHFADPRVGCVTGVEKNPGGEDGAAIAVGGKTYLEYESLINRLESKIGSVLVCDGSIFCIRRSLFAEVKPELANDLELPMRIGRDGHWLLFEPGARSIEHATRSSREEFARRKRICGQGILGMWELRYHLTALRAWQFFSRKFLRWFSLVPLVMILVSSIALARNPWYAMLVVLQLIFFGLATMGWSATARGNQSRRIISLPFYFLLVNLAAMTGVVEAFLGRRFEVWEIAYLSRGKGKAA